MQKNVGRNHSLDLLRILAMIMICFFHYVIHGNGERIFSETFSGQQVVSYAFGSWGLVGVTCFFMISSYFMLDREEVSANKWMQLCGEVISIYMLCIVIAASLGANITIRTLLNGIISPLNGSYWFVTAYLLLIPITPYLNLVIKKCDDHNLIFLTISACFINFCLTPVFNFIGGKTGTDILFLAISLYFVTACLKRNIIAFKIHGKMLLISYLLVAVAECGLSFTASQMGLKQISRHIYDLVDIYSPIPVILGIMSFVYFQNSNFDVGGGISKIARHTFSVYLLHENPELRYLIWDKVFKIDVMYEKSAWMYCFHMLGVVVILFTAGVFLDVVVTTIWKSISRLAFIRSITVLANKYMNLRSDRDV